MGDTELPRVVRIGKEEKGDLPEQGGGKDNMNGYEIGFYLSATWCAKRYILLTYLLPTGPLAELPEEQSSLCLLWCQGLREP